MQIAWEFKAEKYWEKATGENNQFRQNSKTLGNTDYSTMPRPLGCQVNYGALLRGHISPVVYMYSVECQPPWLPLLPSVSSD